MKTWIVWIKNWEGCRRKLSWANLRYYSRPFCGLNQENHNKPTRIVGIPAEIRTRHFQNTSHKRYCSSKLAFRKTRVSWILLLINAAVSWYFEISLCFLSHTSPSFGTTVHVKTIRIFLLIACPKDRKEFWHEKLPDWRTNSVIDWMANEQVSWLTVTAHTESWKTSANIGNEGIL
jgi:hypothetical protein